MGSGLALAVCLGYHTAFVCGTVWAVEGRLLLGVVLTPHESEGFLEISFAFRSESDYHCSSGVWAPFGGSVWTGPYNFFSPCVGPVFLPPCGG